MCVNWYDAQDYVAWLSRTTGATYRLPTGEEWDRAAAGSPAGCSGRWQTFRSDGVSATCLVGSNGANETGLSDMAGNVKEWTQDCGEGDCGRRVLRGGSWFDETEWSETQDASYWAGAWAGAGLRENDWGFRVARTLGGP